MGFPQIATITSSSTLLLKFYEPEFIPTLFLVNGILITIISTLFLLLLKKSRTKLILLYITIGMILGSLTITLLYLLLPHTKLLSAVLFFWSRIENTFLAVAFLIIANTLLSPRSSRRVLAFAASGQVISLIFGGLLFPYILKYFHPIHLMWFSIISHITLFFHLQKFSDSEDTLSYSRENSSKSPLLRYMVITFSLAYLLYYIIDSTFLAIVDFEMDSTVTIGTFFSRFWLVVGICALFCKTLISGKLLHKFGIQTGLIIPPILILLLFISGKFLITPLQLIVGLKFVERVFFTSIFIPGFYTLFQAFRFGTKLKNQLILETVITQIMGLLSGIILLSLHQEEEFSTNIILLLMLIISGLLIISSVLTYRSYSKKMFDILKKPVIKLWNKDESLSQEISEIDTLRSKSFILIHKLKSFSEYCPESNNTIIYDVWLFEWYRLIEQLVDNLSSILSDKRVLERWYKIRESSETTRAKLIEGYRQLLPPPWREPLLSIINREETYLINRSLKSIHNHKDELYIFSKSNDKLTSWTHTVISINQDPESKRLWRKYYYLIDIKNSQFFGRIPTEYLHTLLPAFKLRQYNTHDYVITEGDEGDSMFIQLSGICDIYKGEKRITDIKKGSCVGELALIQPEKRSASIITVTKCDFLELPGSDFISFIERYPRTIQNIQITLFLRMQALIKSNPKRVKTVVEPYITDVSSSINDLNQVKIFNSVSTDVLRDISLNIEYIDLNPGEYYSIDSDNPPLIIIKTGEVIEYWGDREVKNWIEDEAPGIQHLIQHSNFCGQLEIVRKCTLVLISADVYAALLLENEQFQNNLVKQLVTANRALLKNLKSRPKLTS